MKVAGFTIIRNAVKYDYPVLEAIRSVLPLCDEFFIGLGNSEDDTEQLLKSNLPQEKIKYLPSVWNDQLRVGGLVLSEETNKVFDAIPEEFDWCFYIQSDECVHEDDYFTIREAMQKHLHQPHIQGLLFDYVHFYGSYHYVGVSRRWYRREIRIIRNYKNIRSYKDAQGFRTIKNQKLTVALANARIFHYGWVKPPVKQQEKQKNFHKMWHDDEWMKKNIPDTPEYDYSNIDFLEPFNGTHPSVMKNRIEEMNWIFHYDKTKIKATFKDKVLFWIERKTGYRPGENRNYRLIKK
ncbi:MAG: glycosyltransferase family 2 protein [Bacteroidia bacterium]|nr:glycosyltransferase family 2 protein [Bacteroidia bacterium]